MTIRKLCSIVALIVACRVQAQTTDQSIPTLHTSTRIVAVAVVPTQSNGSPVTDLKSSEIQVFDNGKKQTILSFEPMDSDANVTQGSKADISQPAPSSAATHYPHYSVILLDALNTEWSDQVFAQKAVQHLLDYLPPGEHIAILVLSNHLSMLHDFTSNPAELRAALQHLSASMPQGGVSSKPSSPYSAEVSGADLVRLSGQMRMHNALPTAEAAFYQRNRILQTLQTLSGIARLVKNAPGQKNLLWVSSAFPLRVNNGHDTDSFYDQEQKTADDLNSAGLRVYPVDARGLTMSLSAHINVDTMQQLAEQTGGKAFYNNNDLGTEMRLALEDSRKGYLLTYAPNNFRADKSFHTIRVKVSRHGVHLRYRRGYFAESNQSASNLKANHKK